MLKQIIQKNLKLIFAVLFILTAVSSVMMFVPEGITDQLKGMTRWAALLTMVLIGLHYHKITVWIIISMFIGAEIGYDFPAIGDQLNVFSKIFIKLIKCVIARLIFGTLNP